MTLILVAAVARNRVIGGDNRLLWRLKSDLQHFRKLTLGKPVLMGRKTFDSIGRPLPGRDNIVVTRDRQFTSEGVSVVHSVEDAVSLASGLAEARGTSDIMVIGGAEIYAQTIGAAQRLYITHVNLDPAGDALFPLIDSSVWREVDRQTHRKGPDDEADFAFVEYARR